MLFLGADFSVLQDLKLQQLPPQIPKKLDAELVWENVLGKFGGGRWWQ